MVAKNLWGPPSQSIASTAPHLEPMTAMARLSRPTVRQCQRGDVPAPFLYQGRCLSAIEAGTVGTVIKSFKKA